MDCKQASQIISQSLDRKLTLRETLVLKFHLFICIACKQFNQQLMALRTTFKKLNTLIENDTNIQMPSETKKRLLKSIESITD
jgi:predicted anti-sigma-YlaC factor YlaD